MPGDRRLLVAAAVLAAFPLLAAADEAEDTFNSVYGKEYKKVLATREASDDIALAKQLLEATQAADRQPAFLALLCDRAFELASKDPSGYPAALAAMELLAVKVPERRADALAKCADVYQRQYGSAARGDARNGAGEALISALRRLAEAHASAGRSDAAVAALNQALAVATTLASPSRAEVQAQLAALSGTLGSDRQLAALKAKLAANPADAATRKEIVRLYLVEKDDPAEAAKFVDASLDEAARKYIPAAAKPIDQAPELACSELGEWYRGLADQATGPAAEAAMLQRAKAYYERFLQLHTGEDLARTAAVLALKMVDSALAKRAASGQAGSLPGGWTDCLKLVDTSKHVVAGKWEKRDGSLMVTQPGSACRILLPAAPTGSYELQVSFVRMKGDMVEVSLPVGPTSCNLGLAINKNTVSLIEMIDGKHPRECVDALTNGKPCPPGQAGIRSAPLVDGQEYNLDIKVLVRGDQAEIAVLLNNKPFLGWRGPVSALSIFDPWKLPDAKYPALGAWSAVVVFRRAQLRPLAGGDVSLAQAPAAAPPRVPAPVK